MPINSVVPTLTRLKKQWSGIEPIPQPDVLGEVARIREDGEYEQVMDLFRAALSQDERLERDLQLTTLILCMNDSQYQAWMYRKQVISNLQAAWPNIWETELDWIRGVLHDSLKNYQAWQHRQFVAGQLDKTLSISEELDSLDVLLTNDYKNYHLWSYRIWLVSRFECDLANELDMTCRLVHLDPFNNSVWSYRFFLVKHQSRSTSAKYWDAIAREIAYGQSWLDKYPGNQSVANYISGWENEKK